jgi:two-component system cell cycle sensor histidine kinase/response regulator CckA
MLGTVRRRAQTFSLNQAGHTSLWFAVIFALAASIAAAWVGRSMGMQVFAGLFGLVALSILILALLRFKVMSQNTVQDIAVDDALSFRSSIQAIDTPLMIRRDGVPIFCNPAYLELAKSLGVEVFENVPPPVERLFKLKEKSVSAALYRLHHTHEEGEVDEENIQIMTEAGEFRSYNIRVSALEYGQLWQFIDITRELKESDAMLAKAPVGLLSVGADGKIIQMNTVLRDWLGIDIDEELENIKSYLENADSLLESEKIPGRIVRTDTRLTTKKGVVTPAVMVGSWQETETGDFYASLGVYGHTGLGLRAEYARTDMDGQVHFAEMDSKAQEQKDVALAGSLLAEGASLLSDAPFGVVRLDGADLGEAKILSVNNTYTSMAGAHDVVGAKFSDLFKAGEDRDRFIAMGINMDAAAKDIYLAGDNATPVNVYFSNTGGEGCAAYIIDITKRKELEGELVHAQKMQAIGMLVANIAHDFNNLLTVIGGHTYELLVRHPVGDPSYKDLQQIKQNVGRAAGQVNKLLIFSFQKTLRKQVLAVSETLSDASLMLQPAVGERIQLDIVHGRSLPNILVDKEQLETVLMNLCVNARDAMKDKQGGTITIRTLRAKTEDYETDGVEVLDNEKFVIFEIIDEGTGMSPETQEKIFEPFFTTKGQGKGTGLGLATVYGIVKHSGGHLRVQSTLGEGTRFRIYMPTTEREVEQVKLVSDKPADLSGQGRILFVEDEDALRPLAANSLRKRGYKVVEAVDGEDALAVLESGEHTFDLMISDVVMPGLDGPGLLEQGRELLGDARIVFISGYAEEEFSELLEREPGVSFLPKPFDFKQLAEKVKSEIGDAH